MTARKPKARKPVPRKPTDPAIKELRRAVRSLIGITDCQRARIEALETRAQFRDASHDEPVSNRAEAIGQQANLEQPSLWRRFLIFMRSP